MSNPKRKSLNTHVTYSAADTKRPMIVMYDDEPVGRIERGIKYYNLFIDGCYFHRDKRLIFEYDPDQPAPFRSAAFSKLGEAKDHVEVLLLSVKIK